MKAIFTLVLAGFLGLAAQAQNNSASTGHVKSATAVSRVLGDGRKVETVVLEYDAPISNRSLTTGSYEVEGKEIVRVYANTAPERAEKGTNGQYVIIEVKAEVDLNAQPKRPTEADMEKKRERDRMQGGPGLRAGWSTGGDDEYPGNATVYQIANIRTAKGKTYAASAEPVETTEEICLVADDFR
ncbi:MAG: hypothetical protein K2I32_07385, partial [Alistipes sp.]|nr:hypothetical protein [Alistipes sp.]